MKRVDNTKLGRSMMLCAGARADSFREVDDGAVLNAYWRSDPKATVKIFTATAAWHDAKTGESGGARDFARRNGMTLTAMLAAFPAERGARTGAPQVPAPASPMLPPMPAMPPPPPPPIPRLPPLPPMPPTTCERVWAAAKKDMAAKERARSYLANERGLHGFVENIDETYAGYNPSVGQAPGRMEEHALAVALTDPNGHMQNVSFRFFQPRGGPKCMTLPGHGTGNGSIPLGFGRMRDATHGAPRVLIVEGTRWWPRRWSGSTSASLGRLPQVYCRRRGQGRSPATLTPGLWCCCSRIWTRTAPA